jgi:glycerol-3-phosphate O-acyltransferase/dihydroxyacetone phosphate acyltransferase
VAVAAPAAPAGDRLYAAVRVVARFWVWFLFTRVDVRQRERVPAAGPVLLCINHPNNLIDSLLVGAVLERKVHYLATAALFRNPLLGRFLRACGAIPVYRRQDDADRMDRNADVFAACHRALAEGRVLAIYPEGTTHAEARVQRIKTGAARIALAFAARQDRPGDVASPVPAAPGEGLAGSAGLAAVATGDGDARGSAGPVAAGPRAARTPPPADGSPELALIPVGLSFEARKSFRGRVLVSFGPPVPVTAYVEAYRRDPPRAVEALTDAIQWAMEAQVVHVDRIDATALVRAVEALYRDALVRELREERGLGERDIDVFRLARTIVDAVEHFRRREPERVERLWQRIQAYQARLDAHRVRDEAVQARLTRATARGRLRWSWQAVAGLPLFAYGATVNALPYLGPRWLARRLARRETDYATVRLLASVVAFPAFWGLEVWLVARAAGPRWALAFALSLPLSGIAAYRYLRGLGRLRRGLRFGLLALTRAHAARELLAERQAIVAELDRAKTDYLAATRGASF